MRVAILDGYNLMHRSRFGAKGDNGIVYTFFRSLRPLLAEINPDKVYFVLEGAPVHRQALDSEYKMNRKLEPGTKKWEEMVEFRRQRDIIVNLIRMLPITVARHPHVECDDTIASLVELHSADECVVVSTDTDFIQLLSRENVKLYNPIRKDFVEGVSFDYVSWKALRGDKTDNVPAVAGMTDKASEKMIADPAKLASFLNEGTNRQDYERNLDLIRLKIVPADEIEFSHPEKDFVCLRSSFAGLRFFSMTNDTAWNKYIETFETIY